MSYPGSTAPAIAVLVVLTAVAAVGPRRRAGARPPDASTRPRRCGAAGAPATIEKQKALVDRSCVTCHNNRVKTANLSLEGLDFARVGDHAEVWEKVVRKLRAGVMPPPDVRRPPLAEYEGLRDWLESEIDRHAATRVQSRRRGAAPPEPDGVRATPCATCWTWRSTSRRSCRRTTSRAASTTSPGR